MYGTGKGSFLQRTLRIWKDGDGGKADPATGKKYRGVSGDRVLFEQLIEDPNWEILFVDDLQMMQEEKDLQAAVQSHS